MPFLVLAIILNEYGAVSEETAISMAIGIQKKDEVIVPTQTFVSTASCVVNNGGLPIFCEIDNNHLLDFEDLKEKISENTKAVIIVHFCGLIHPDIYEIKSYLQEREIILIEDAAHAHGAKIDDKYAGSIGDFGCFSFYSTKIITTGGEGGFISLNDEKYYTLCESIRAIGIDRSSDTENYNIAGSNNRMTEFQGIMGISQLNRLESFVTQRNELAEIYKNKLSKLKDIGLIRFQEYPESIRHPYWRFVVILTDEKVDRISIKEKLLLDDIHIDWPYQPLLHSMPLFSEINQQYLTRSDKIAKKHLCLPLHLGISKNDADFIANKFLQCFQ